MVEIVKPDTSAHGHSEKHIVEKIYMKIHIQNGRQMDRLINRH